MVTIRREVEVLYNEYLNQTPLDLIGAPKSEINGWRNNVQLTMENFSRIIALIYKNNNLRNFTRENLDLDFDNVEPILSLLVTKGKIEFIEMNTYKVIDLPIPNKMKELDSVEFTKNPNNDFNQFPCSTKSRIKRVERLITDFPYADDLKIGLMGDDDLVSLEIATRTNFTPIVFELDEKVISQIRKFSNERNLDIKIIEKDFRELDKDVDSVDTFIADPPYTTYGIITFLYYGLRIQKTNLRFYLIANDMFLGKIGYPKIMKTLSDAGVFPIEIKKAFNEYPLPKNYRESEDLSNKLKTFGNIDTSEIMSSSSSLFVMIKKDINLDKLQEAVANKEDIYDRYAQYSND